MRTQREIDQQLNRAAAMEERGRTKYFGMTFEQGVSQALNWVIGLSEEPPCPDEDYSDVDGDGDEE